MSSRRGFLSEISWFQVSASALAAVTAAWIASRLGVAGTLIGAALGSFVVTISTSFYGRTLDKGKTLIVQTAAGTIVQKTVHDGEISEAFDEVADSEGSPVKGAEIIEDDEPGRLHWKTIIATTLLVLALAVGAMGAYEAVTGNAFGDGDNARIGNPLGGSGRSGGSDDSPDTPDDSEETLAPKPTPKKEPSRTTPAPSVSTPAPAQTPAPAATTPAPTSSPTPTATPTPSATPTVPAE